VILQCISPNCSIQKLYSVPLRRGRKYRRSGFIPPPLPYPSLPPPPNADCLFIAFLSPPGISQLGCWGGGGGARPPHHPDRVMSQRGQTLLGHGNGSRQTNGAPHVPEGSDPFGTSRRAQPASVDCGEAPRWMSAVCRVLLVDGALVRRGQTPSGHSATSASLRCTAPAPCNKGV
jgi:hypothetical protein